MSSGIARIMANSFYDIHFSPVFYDLFRTGNFFSPPMV